ncbi:unnamed protein product [Protopolystoma xenopodis]|uniref:Uncharacterized protein n=1 Tax=Protopolystoma xenopodis TaxID=117903 RepID=A0A448X028_9PLAT|nr:unnamed protein product [Protopolystoma xenopodis]
MYMCPLQRLTSPIPLRPPSHIFPYVQLELEGPFHTRVQAFSPEEHNGTATCKGTAEDSGRNQIICTPIPR